MLAIALHNRVDLVSAATLRDAKALLAKEAFDLILLEPTMTELSGTEVIAQISSGGQNPPPPIVVLSAEEISDDVRDPVAAAMTKSRLPDEVVVSTILKQVARQCDGPEGNPEIKINKINWIKR
ncbi:response regulator [Breoghania sp.]|uniref:response regulator n=1 Tax=Breoghania sp. TaxID=2065378 RepID=UPI002620B86D|nr:response regulator [Breoghania sp.]MDJ0933311.1 response regulator [Breoghania sp.]